MQEKIVISIPWSAWEYRGVLSAFYQACSKGMQAEIDQRLARLLQLGNFAREPISKFLEDGIFELRTRCGKEQARFLYYFDSGKRIIFVVAVYKDQRKISRSDIENAKNIRTILKAEKEQPHDLTKYH